MEISARVATWIDTVVPNIRSRSIAQSSEFNSRPGIANLQLSTTLIRYRMVGDGPQTLVLAADPPVVIEQYDELIQCLKDDFRVIVFELPGFGFSLPRSGFRFDFAKARLCLFLSFPSLFPFPPRYRGSVPIAGQWRRACASAVLGRRGEMEARPR